MVVYVQVNIWVPQPEKQLDVIKVTGLAANVERAKQGLLERVKELQAEQEDRVRPCLIVTDKDDIVKVFECLRSVLVRLPLRRCAVSRLPCP